MSKGGRFYEPCKYISSRDVSSISSSGTSVNFISYHRKENWPGCSVPMTQRGSGICMNLLAWKRGCGAVLRVEDCLAGQNAGEGGGMRRDCSRRLVFHV